MNKIIGEDEFQAELNESLYPWPLLKVYYI